MEKVKIGLVLGSGGSRGLAHIGALKVFSEENIPLTCLTGSSIGALVGAHYALYQDIEKLEQLVLSNNWRTAFKLFDLGGRGGIIKGEKMEKLLNEWFQNKNFSDLKIPFAAVATDLISGEAIAFTQGSLATAVRASISVPSVFRPFLYQKKLLVDGGISQPLPIGLAKQLGATKIIAINLDASNLKNKFSSTSLTLTQVSWRTLNIMRYYLAKSYLPQADVLLEPVLKNIGLVGWKQFFSPSEAKQIIASGEKAARQALPQIKKLLSSSSNKKKEIKSKKQ